MTRKAGIVALIALVALVVIRAGGSGEGDYRVDALFDSAKGLVPGQVVKIAGARVGKVTDVRLAPGPSARVSMSVPERYGPFGSDARCRILPEGIISEKFVECDVGARTADPLAPDPQGRPTVPRSRTTIPLSAQDLFDVFSVPTSQRLRVLLSELGLGLSGRGSDLNDLLRRANPALGDARRALSLVDAQRRALTDAVEQTDLVLADLAKRRRDVRAFVASSSQVLQVTGARRRQLEESVRRLPRTLSAVRTSLRSIDRLAREGRPLLGDLRGATPAALTATRRLSAFSAAGLPAMRALTATAARTRKALPVISPVVRDVRRFSRQGRLTMPAIDQFLRSVRDRGGSEHLLRLMYRLSTVTSAYDAVSHMISLYVFVEPQCIADRTRAGCSHAYRAPGAGKIPINAPAADGEAAAPSRRQVSDRLDYLFG